MYISTGHTLSLPLLGPIRGIGIIHGHLTIIGDLPGGGTLSIGAGVTLTTGSDGVGVTRTITTIILLITGRDIVRRTVPIIDRLPKTGHLTVREGGVPDAPTEVQRL